MSMTTAVEMKLTRVALAMMLGLAVAGVSTSLAGRSDIASFFALAELDVVWMTLLATGVVFRRRGVPLLVGWRGIATSLPPAPVRRAITFEVGLIAAIAHIVTRRPPQVPAGAHAFSSKKGTLSIPIAFAVATVVEIAVLHLVISWPALVGALSLISVYALVLLFGVIAIRWDRPHYVTASALVLRNGTHTVATIPLDDIEAVTVRSDGSATSPTVDGALARLATLNGCSVSVRLRVPHPITLTSGRHARNHAVTEIRLAVDDAHAMANLFARRA
jgi:hypothetical protein